MTVARIHYSKNKETCLTRHNHIDQDAATVLGEHRVDVRDEPRREANMFGAGHQAAPRGVLSKPSKSAPAVASKVPFGKIPRCVLSQMWKAAQAFSCSICSSLS